MAVQAVIGMVLLTAGLEPVGAWSTTGTMVAGRTPSWGPAANKLWYPQGTTIDSAGNLYVADYRNDRVQKWAPGATSGTTVAGGNGRGSAANQLAFPSGVAVDAMGNLYVADSYNHRVQRFPAGSTSASSGTTVAGVGYPGSAANQLSSPRGVTVDASRNVYVADLNNHRIQKWALGGTSGTTVAGGNGAGSAQNQLNQPASTRLDRSGNLFVVDSNNNRVLRFPAGSTAATSGATVAGGNGSGSAANQLYRPTGIVLDGADNLYVADANNNRVQRFAVGSTQTTNATTVAGGNGPGTAANQVTNPSGIALDSSGNLYVAELLNHRVQRFPVASTSATNGVRVAGAQPSWGPAADQFDQPRGVAVDTAGNVYVLDSRNNRVQKWAPGATSGVTIAGGRGQGSAAYQLSWPSDLVNDGAGNIYVADTFNSRVQKWAPGATSGVTVAGGKNTDGTQRVPFPSTVAVDTKNNVYVIDASNRIQKWAPGATAGVVVAGGYGTGSAANQFSSPGALTIDEAGNLYIADTNNNRVQKWAPGATYGVTVAGGNGSGPGATQLSSPRGIARDALGNLYVADTNNFRVQRFPAGSTSLTSGTTIFGGNGSGPALNQLDGMDALTLDALGNLYIAEEGNQRVTKWLK